MQVFSTMFDDHNKGRRQYFHTSVENIKKWRQYFFIFYFLTASVLYLFFLWIIDKIHTNIALYNKVKLRNSKKRFRAMWIWILLTIWSVSLNNHQCLRWWGASSFIYCFPLNGIENLKWILHKLQNSNRPHRMKQLKLMTNI